MLKTQINLLKTVFFIVTLTSSLSGCSDFFADSEDVQTQDMRANIQVTASGQHTFVHAQLSDAYGNLRLHSSDRLWASTGNPINRSLNSNDLFAALGQLSQDVNRLRIGQAITDPFIKDQITGTWWYEGQSPISLSNLYYVALIRGNSNHAWDSHVTVPPAFIISAPLANETHRRQNPLTFHWQAGVSLVSVSIYIQSLCQNDAEYTWSTDNLIDDGHFVLPAEDFAQLGEGPCETTITVIKSEQGHLDEHFLGGSISGHRLSTVTFNTTE